MTPEGKKAQLEKMRNTTAGKAGVALQEMYNKKKKKKKKKKIGLFDRLREMVSTVVNILGDAVATMYVARKESQINMQKYNLATWMG